MKTRKKYNTKQKTTHKKHKITHKKHKITHKKHKITHKKHKITHKKHKTKIQPSLENINNYGVLFINNKSKTISIQSYIFKGFIHETKSNMGINHLLEHVLSNAYKKCDDYNCYEYLNLMGLLSNASTDHNIIQYYTTGLKDTTIKMLEYIVNITVNPIFNENLVTKEKEAVHNELLISLDNPDQKLYDKMAKNFYTIEGLKYMDDDQLMIDNLKNLDYKYLMKYYKENYGYNNTLFIVSGSYDKNEVVKTLKKILPNNNKKMKEIINYKQLNCFVNKSGFYHIKNPALQSTKILFYFPTNFYINSNKIIALSLASSILQVILFDKLRVEEELIYNIKFNTIVNTCGTIQNIFVNTKNINLISVLNECKKILNKYKKQSIEKKYIDAEKKKYLVNHYDTTYDSSQYADLYGPQFIYNQFLDTRILSPDQYQKSIMKITAAEIKTIINQVFDFNKCMIVYSNNEKKINKNF